MNDTIARLNAELEKRDRLFPLRDADNTAAMHELMNRLVADIAERREAQWRPDRALVDRVAPIRDNAVFLCGYMKSGTTLLLGLLDGHDALNVMPGDSYIVNKFTPEAQRKNDFSWQAWQNNWVKRMINATGQKPFWLFGTELTPYTRFLQYMEYWHMNLPAHHRRPVLAAVFSYFCANPHRPRNPQLWIEKTPGNEFRIDDILNLFPASKFIHIVRDPRENLASLKRLYSSRGWTWDCRDMVKTLGRSCTLAHRHQKRLGRSRYLVLRYEDLTAETTSVMQDIAAFLNIHWDDCLLKPTVNGRPARANTMYQDRQVTGTVRKSGKGKWRDELDEHEKRAALSLFPEAKAMGYVWKMNKRDYVNMLLYRLRLR